MHPGRIYILLLAYSIFLLPGKAQDQARLDSLRSIIKTSDTDSIIAGTFIALGDEYMDADPSLAIDYYRQALKISRSKNFISIEGVALNNLGYMYYQLGSVDKALRTFQEAYRCNEKAGDKKEQGITLINIASVYQSKGQTEQQMEAMFKGLHLFEEIKDTTSMVVSYLILGNLYYEHNQVEKSKSAFEDALNLSALTGNKSYEAKALNDLGSIYELMEDYNAALDHYLRSAKIRMETDEVNELVSNYINIGSLYKKKKRYKEAEAYFIRAVNLSNETKIIDDQAYSSRMLALLYSEIKEYNKALFYFREAEKKASFYDEKINIALGLSHVFAATGNYKEALKQHENYVVLKDSLMNENNSRILTEMTTKYETEKKETENLLLKQKNDIQELELSRKTSENARQRTIIIASSAGVLLLGMLAFLLQNRNRIRKRANDQLKAAYQIIEEKNRDITDSIEYAQRLQEAILPDPEVISKSFPESFIYFQPRDIVSGDFYFYHERDNKVFLAASDCTGHGVPGAFISMICNNLLYQIIAEKKIDDPGEILTEVNAGVRNSFRKEGSKVQASDGMDTSLLVYDKMSRKISFAGANNSIYILSEGKFIELAADRVAIGGRTDSNYRFQTQQYSPLQGDIIYLFSDGYADQFGGPKGKKFLIKRFKELLHTTSHYPLRTQMDEIHQNLISWQGEHDRVDDVLVIGVKILE